MLLVELFALESITVQGATFRRDVETVEDPAHEVVTVGDASWVQVTSGRTRWLMPGTSVDPRPLERERLRAPTATDVEVTVPALCVADVALTPDRRTLDPSAEIASVATGCHLLALALDPTVRLAMVPSPTLPAGPSTWSSGGCRGRSDRRCVVADGDRRHRRARARRRRAGGPACAHRSARRRRRRRDRRPRRTPDAGRPGGAVAAAVRRRDRTVVGCAVRHTDRRGPSTDLVARPVRSPRARRRRRPCARGRRDHPRAPCGRSDGRRCARARRDRRADAGGDRGARRRRRLLGRNRPPRRRSPTPRQTRCASRLGGGGPRRSGPSGDPGGRRSGTRCRADGPDAGRGRSRRCDPAVARWSAAARRRGRRPSRRRTAPARQSAAAGARRRLPLRCRRRRRRRPVGIRRSAAGRRRLGSHRRHRRDARRPRPRPARRGPLVGHPRRRAAAGGRRP